MDEITSEDDAFLKIEEWLDDYAAEIGKPRETFTLTVPDVEVSKSSDGWYAEMPSPPSQHHVTEP